MKWTEREMAKAIHSHVFRGRHLVVVPNCNWTGFEADLLVVRRDLRLVDIEIKVTRQDLKADAGKDKWLDIDYSGWNIPMARRRELAPRRTHPVKIWKHYYCIPKELWTDGIEDCINPASGVLFIKGHPHAPERPLITVKRHARPCRDAKPIDADGLCHIAILSSNRMWDAFDEVDTHRRSREVPADKPEGSRP